MISIRDHVYAVRKILVDAGWRTHVGDVRESTPKMPYVLVKMPPGTPKTDTLGPYGDELKYFQPITVVADSADTLLYVIDDVRASLDGAVPEVKGRVAEPLRIGYSSGLFTDDQVNLTGGGHPAYAVDMWTMCTHDNMVR